MPKHTHYSLFSILLFVIINNKYLLILSTANILIFNGYTYFKIKIAILYGLHFLHYETVTLKTFKKYLQKSKFRDAVKF